MCFFTGFRNAGEFPVDVELRFFEVFNSFSFESGSPDIFNSVPQTEVHVLSDVDALDSAWV